MRLEDINIFDVGNKWGLLGAVFGDEEEALLCMFPDATTPLKNVKYLEMDNEDWIKFLFQTDVLATEVLTKADDGKLATKIKRKSQRIIDNRVSWQVYKRDGYRCRYCGRDGIPLTVDHLICWEEGGPSDPANLATTCRKCNKVRGTIPYEEWLEHDYYRKVSKNLSKETRDLNLRTVDEIAKLPRLRVMRGERK